MFCYQKNYVPALNHLNEYLPKVSKYSYFADRFKVLIEKLKEKLKRKDDIDMSYIPTSTLKISQRSRSMTTFKIN